MKGFNGFVASLLPGAATTAKLGFTNEGVESTVKVFDGNLIVKSRLSAPSNLVGDIAVPSLSSLSKAMKVLGEYDIKLHEQNGTFRKLQLKNPMSNVNLFLMNPDIVKSVDLNKEPEWDITVPVSVESLGAMKSMFTLIDSDVSCINGGDGRLVLSVGNDARSDSDSGIITVDDSYDGHDIKLSVSTKILSTIIGSIRGDSVVSMSVFTHGMIKISVVASTDEYTVETDYYIRATRG